MTFFIETYGSYTDLVYAIGVISRIIQSSEFSNLLTICFILAALLGAAYTAFNTFLKGGKVRYSWAANLLLGLLLVVSFVRPTATVVVEDKYYSKSGTAGYFTTIKDVPLGPALMIWFYSSMQSAFTTMIDKYGSPIISLEDGGTDVSYQLITGMGSLPDAVQKASPKFVPNMKSYIVDCVLPGVAQEQIDIAELNRPTSDLWKSMKISGVSGLVYTTEYNGSIISCSVAHDQLTNEYNVLYPDIAANYCPQYGIDKLACENKIDSLTQGFFNKNARDYMLTYLSATLTKNIVEESVDLADKQTNISNATMAMQAEKWLPKLRANTFVIVVLLAPIVLLLVAFAPGAVVRWYGGMYVWLILWGAADQLMFVIYQKELYDLFQTMRSSGLGILHVLDAGSYMLETMGLYGKMRFASMTLSLAMCMGILRIGNHAMVSMAESMGAAAQQTAGQAASSLSTAGGTSAARESMIAQKARGWAAEGVPDTAIANREIQGYSHAIAAAEAKQALFGMDANDTGLATGAAAAYNEVKNTYGSVQEQELLGSNAANRAGAVQGVNSAASIAATEGKIGYAGGKQEYMDTQANMDLTNFQHSLGSQDGMHKRAEILGGDIRSLGEFSQTGALNEKQADHLYKEYGFNVQAGDQVSFGVDGNGEASNFTVSRNTENGKMSAVYSNNGKLAYTTYEGNIGNGQGSQMYDGAGNLVYQNISSGSQQMHYDVSKTVIEDGVDVGETVARGIMDGNHEKVHDVFTNMNAQGVDSNSKEWAEQVRPFIESQAKHLSQYASNNSGEVYTIGNNSYLRVGGGVNTPVVTLQVGSEFAASFNGSVNLSKNEFQHLLTDNYKKSYDHFQNVNKDFQIMHQGDTNIQPEYVAQKTEKEHQALNIISNAAYGLGNANDSLSVQAAKGFESVAGDLSGVVQEGFSGSANPPKSQSTEKSDADKFNDKIGKS